MKKIRKFCCLVVAVVIICSQAMLVSAAPVEAEEEIIVSVEREYLENGDYIETVITESPIATYSNSKTGSKTSEYYGDGVALWYVKVTGSFTYTGSSVWCTSASVSADSYSSYWGISNRSSSYSGNIATAKATGTRYFGNAVVERINETVNLSCSVNGSLY